MGYDHTITEIAIIQASDHVMLTRQWPENLTAFRRDKIVSIMVEEKSRISEIRIPGREGSVLQYLGSRPIEATITFVERTSEMPTLLWDLEIGRLYRLIIDYYSMKFLEIPARLVDLQKITPETGGSGSLSGVYAFLVEDDTYAFVIEALVHVNLTMQERPVLSITTDEHKTIVTEENVILSITSPLDVNIVTEEDLVCSITTDLEVTIEP